MTPDEIAFVLNRASEGGAFSDWNKSAVRAHASIRAHAETIVGGPLTGVSWHMRTEISIGPSAPFAPSIFRPFFVVVS